MISQGKRSFLARYGVVSSAASLSIIALAAYAGMLFGPHSWYHIFQYISWIGMPGIMLMAVLTRAVESLGALAPLSGTVAGGIILLLMTVAMPAGNFVFYMGLALAVRKVVRLASRKKD
jgi:hypothetical protein